MAAKNSATNKRPIMALLELISKKWAMRILWELHIDTATFRQLQQRCDDASPTILNKRLSELREAKLVEHDRIQGYHLTSLANELIQHFMPLSDWAKRWQKKL